MKILVTGARGFVGSALIEHLSRCASNEIIGTTRDNRASETSGGTLMAVGTLCAETEWLHVLEGVDVVVHLAGRAHVQGKEASDEGTFDEVNVQGTLRLARQAQEMGVKRFIFISSIGVNGSRSKDVPFTESAMPAPDSAYARSKYRAECRLRKQLIGTTMELTIIRPPLVYAANAPGNFRSLLKLASSGLPLPFGSLTNGRSLISLGNLVSFIEVCLTHSGAVGQLFLVSDRDDLTMRDIVRYLRLGMGLSERLVTVPHIVLLGAAKLVGRQAAMVKLSDELLIDCSHACRLLGWVPPAPAAESLISAGRRFVSPED